MNKGLICLYSSTGNTRIACKYITKNIPDVQFDFFDIATTSGLPDFSKYDIFGFATYADRWLPPKHFTDFVNSIPVLGKATPTFIFNTYGLLSVRTLKVMHDLLKCKNFHVFSGFSLRAPESYPPLAAKHVSINTPDDTHLKKFNSFISELNKAISEYFINKEFPRIQKIQYGFINMILPKYPSVFQKFIREELQLIKDSCIKCNRCITVCKFNAISIGDDMYPKIKHEKCNMCWNCYNLCPEKAIYSKRLKGQGHYIIPKSYKDKLSYREE